MAARRDMKRSERSRVRPKLPAGDEVPEGDGVGAERAREQAERELQRLADAAEYGASAVISVGRDGRVRHWNQGAERLLGDTEREALGRTGEELSLYVGDSPVAQNMARALAGEGPFQFEAQRRRKDGAAIDVLATVLPWRDDGTVVGLTGVLVDTTERKAAERELERLAEAAQHSLDAVISLDLDSRICHWSAGAEAVLGFSAQEVVGLTWREFNALSGESEDADRRLGETFARVLAGETVRRDLQRRRRTALSATCRRRSCLGAWTGGSSA